MRREIKVQVGLPGKGINGDGSTANKNFQQPSKRLTARTNGKPSDYDRELMLPQALITMLYDPRKAPNAVAVRRCR
jgi:hypothetical protein